MYRPVYNEEPSLVELYGEESAEDIVAVAREYNISPKVLRDTLRKYPEFMGACMGAEARSAVGDRLVSLTQNLTGLVDKIAPAVASGVATAKGIRRQVAATRGGGAISSYASRQPVLQAQRTGFDPMMLAIPAIGLALFMMLKK